MELIDHTVCSLEAGGDDFFVELITEVAGQLQRRAAAAKSDRRESNQEQHRLLYDAVAERFVGGIF
jgi:hypothetical protein